MLAGARKQAATVRGKLVAAAARWPYKIRPCILYTVQDHAFRSYQNLIFVYFISI
jgi:hypothetical protein